MESQYAGVRRGAEGADTWLRVQTPLPTSTAHKGGSSPHKGQVFPLINMLL